MNTWNRIALSLLIFAAGAFAVIGFGALAFGCLDSPHAPVSKCVRTVLGLWISAMFCGVGAFYFGRKWQ